MKSTKRLTELIDNYLDRRLSSADKAVLEELLRNDAGNRRLFWNRAGTEGLLQEWGQSLDGEDLESIDHQVAGPRSWWASPGFRIGLGMAALLVLCFSLWLTQSRTVEPVASAPTPFPAVKADSAVGVMTRVSDATWRSGTTSFVTGSLVGIGPLELDSGIAVVEFTSGCQAMIEGPATIRILSGQEMDCSDGRVTLLRPSSSSTFAVRTPAAMIGETGQLVSLRVHPNGTDLLAGAGGTSFRLKDGAVNSVPEGEALRITPEEKVVASAGMKEEFTRQMNRADLRSIESRNQSAAWLIHSKKQNESPGTLLRYTFDLITPGSRKITNEAILTGSQLDAQIEGAGFTSGRWPTKGAIEFNRTLDGVSLEIPGSFDQVTMSCWIKVDGLDHSLNTIFSSNGIHQGCLHWQISETGSLKLCSFDNGLIDYESPPVFNSARIGKWQHLAVIYNLPGRSVQHYLNGRLLSQNVLKQSTQVHFGKAMLGNWNPNDYNLSDKVRNLRGSIDEFTIYKRALTSDEINSLYENGSN